MSQVSSDGQARKPNLLEIGQLVELACIWEARARKLGNVTPKHSFPDTAYHDFLASAKAIGPVLEAARDRPVGETILEAIRATRQVTNSNTNLGIVLLLVPLTKVPPERNLSSGVVDVLETLSVWDAQCAFEAIRLAAPGGLGKAAEQDVQSAPTIGLREAMYLAADRDAIARQYANGYRDVFEIGVESLKSVMSRGGALEEAILWCQLTFMAEIPDTLIGRKRGLQEAERAARKARAILNGPWPNPTGFAEFDSWLRQPGAGRNPGATADLVTASLFAAAREAIINLDAPFDWPAGFEHA